MKDILNHLFDGKTLNKAQAKATLIDIANGVNCNNSQIASFITSFLMRSITVPELEGFREALLELCLPIDLSDYNPIDLCGTGGDGKNAFNISTISSFVVAASGVNVAKHGNYGVSSMVGSSNVMEYLGLTFTNNPDKLRAQIEKAGICFLHAPLFHPALKNLAPIRKELGVKTFFNILGPMVNPVKPKNQIVGVFSLELARLYGYIYQNTDKNYYILHSLDGYDEISLTAPFKIIGRNIQNIFEPSQFGLPKLSPEQLKGGESLEQAGKILVQILKNEGTEAQNSVVCINSAFAIQCALPNLSIEEAYQKAKETLQSGKAYERLKILLSV
jgi:anthranilate phosphoribosyltransferase